MRQHGEPMTLRRPATPATNPMTFTDVTVYGKRLAAAGRMGEVGDVLVGALTQKTLRVIIGNTEMAAAGWPGPPKKNDRIVIAGREYSLIDDADTRTDAGATLMHFLTARG